MNTAHVGRSLALTAVLLAATAVPAGADPAPPLPGGSNYDFYYLNGCYREAYGVVNTYDQSPGIIAYQLGQMHASGQDRLTIGVFHHHGNDSGTIMDSTGGALSAHNGKNLSDLLGAVKAAGFTEVTAAFDPVDGNNPTGWDSWQEQTYQENWGLVQSVHATLAASGLKFRIDLGNELTPSGAQDIVTRYDQQLWHDYTARFGAADSVGFSVDSNDPGQLPNVGKVYGSNPPPVFDLHVYGNEHNQYAADSKQLAQQGYGSQPVIIGESYYNDSTAAQGFAQAVKDTGRQILYLTQWPKTRADTPQCDQVDVAPPSAYSAYKAAGF